MNSKQITKVISEKYRIIKLLGEGGVGKTYEAENITTSEKVAIKTVSLRQTKDWKVLELFEREAKTLASLNHPAIPKYIEYFHVDTAEDRYFYLVRELVTGDSLFDLVKKGKRFNESEVKQIAIKVLEILDYLHQQTPLIIHRDIKPQNLIRSTDGKLFLVDFGSVQEIYRQTLSGGSTFVGTLGYMPPEQLRGQTSFATDLYSLGATLLFLLTKQTPDKLPQKKLKLDVRASTKVSDKFANWLDKLLEPIVEERFQSVAEALEVFYSENKFPQPANSRIVLTRNQSKIEIKMPNSGFQGSILIHLYTHGIFSLAAVLTALFISAVVNLIAFATKSLIFATLASLSLIPFWRFLIYPLGMFFWGLFGYTEIEIDRDRFKLRKSIFKLGKQIYGKTNKIQSIEQGYTSYDVDDINDNKSYCCHLNETSRTTEFGYMIRPDEQKWIVNEISDFITQIN
ncbi:serine/threonine-protein kinase [Myxosarcina sp. GI1]|uniref:serine/threonine protein kinase n=1 Tax=Myxosarcina sp. GI1 TaxID=1541065 RepID=UPI00055F0963|nr:serine/threonine-protein kinase [Myxosarcina sp. GI1]